MRPGQIPYGVKDFKRVRLENFYYVDKSSFIEKLEQRANFLFFVRPRRFGESMPCGMPRCYCDVAEKENLEKLFGGLYAGARLTAARPFITFATNSRDAKRSIRQRARRFIQAHRRNFCYNLRK